MAHPPPQVEFLEDVAQENNEQLDNQVDNLVGTNNGDQENEWNSQEIFDELAEMSWAIQDNLHAHATQHELPQHVPQEEVVIPDGAMFAVDLPVVPQPHILPEPPLNHLALQPAEPVPVHGALSGRRILVARRTPVTYDDDDVPRGSLLWVMFPERHPWVIDGRAYICPHASCEMIVQPKHRRVHDAIFHGIQRY